jgi:hypothetical protein
MKEGVLTWDANAKRPDIRYFDGTYYGGLHCGDTFEALLMGKWLWVRIEFRHSTGTWYLFGIENGDDILWQTVRK